MTALARPRHPLIERALADARAWCEGHIIDDRPALAHAVRVAAKLDQHAPGRPRLVCAALLHDSPEFAPARPALDGYLTGVYGTEVSRVVRAMAAQHHALDSDNPPIELEDQSVLLVAIADKIVALGSLLHRAHLSGDVTRFFARREPLLRLLPYFEGYQRTVAAWVPAAMAWELATVLERMRTATMSPGERKGLVGGNRPDRTVIDGDRLTKRGLVDTSRGG